jgi:hypothetical protein
MNVRRGLFRLWMVISAVWVATVSAMYFEAIQSPRIPEANFLYIDGADAIVKIPERNSRSEMRKTMTEVSFPNNVSLFTKQHQAAEKARSTAAGFLIDHVEPRNPELWAKRRDTVQLALEVAMVPISVSFALGAVLIWAFSGLSRRSKLA